MSKATIVLAGVLILLVVAEALFAPHHHPVFPWHHVPGFLAMVGLVSCIVVVKLSKVMGKWWLQRSEEYDA